MKVVDLNESFPRIFRSLKQRSYEEVRTFWKIRNSPECGTRCVPMTWQHERAPRGKLVAPFFQSTRWHGTMRFSHVEPWKYDTWHIIEGAWVAYSNHATWQASTGASIVVVCDASLGCTQHALLLRIYSVLKFIFPISTSLIFLNRAIFFSWIRFFWVFKTF